MTINARMAPKIVNVRLIPRGTKKATTNFSQIGSTSPLTNLADLEDFDPSNVQDKYVIMYDAVTQKYITVNPDKVLQAATTEPVQPGLPNVFLDELDVQLDNRIDLDGGTF
jgi:hypothetical protein